MATLTDRLLGGRSLTTGAAVLGGAAAAAGALYWYLSRTPSALARQAVIVAVGTANPPHCGTNEQFRAAVSGDGGAVGVAGQCGGGTGVLWRPAPRANRPGGCVGGDSARARRNVPPWWSKAGGARRHSLP